MMDLSLVCSLCRVLLAVVLGAPIPGQPRSPTAAPLATIAEGVIGAGLVDDTAEIVQAVSAPWIEQYQPPGVMIVVYREGQAEFFPHGVASRATKRPVTADSIFELASVTKVFTTTSLALEVETGQMQLRDHVDKYLPVLQQGHDIRQVTLEQLATHTSSLPRVPGKRPRSAWNREQIMDWLIHWRAPEPPGTKSLYSNLALGVLGYAIATHEGQPLQQVWNRQFLHPLEMHSTFFEIPADAAGRLVQGYNAAGRPVDRERAPGGWPAGGRLCSSGRDMARFLEANLCVLPDHPRITKAMQLAQQPYFKVSEQMVQGLSWQRVHVASHLTIDKNGGLDGTSTYIGLMPDKRLGVVVLANRGKAQATILGRRLLMKLVNAPAESDPPPAGIDDEEPE